ncbi:hypothetical protein LCGC14_0536930 [marine sediment metagenome]|uniref:Uncharacterized protein n=1 Tax=marine sediment metagenome TaxID=412755 RepID=A0A0F9V242_9ZZZZ
MIKDGNISDYSDNWITKKDCEVLSKKHGRDGVIIISFNFEKGEFGYASYGKDKKYCDKMKAIADQIYDKIINGEFQ